MTVEFEINISQADLDRALGKNGGVVDRAMENIARNVHRQVIVEMPKDSGEMARRTVIRRLASGVWTLVIDVPYAAAVIKGTRPRVIRARKATALAFDVGGKTVFAKWVKHPGTPANDFLTRAVRKVLR